MKFHILVHALTPNTVIKSLFREATKSKSPDKVKEVTNDVNLAISKMFPNIEEVTLDHT